MMRPNSSRWTMHVAAGTNFARSYPSCKSGRYAGARRLRMSAMLNKWHDRMLVASRAAERPHTLTWMNYPFLRRNPPLTDFISKCPVAYSE